jgi:gamma-glutamylcyclotransferase (GGCT)/AIG2-like uncharacterized protein YtfP
MHGLEASTGRNFLGASGDEQDRYEVMDLFIRAGLREFLQARSEMCPSFTQMIRRILLETRVGVDSEMNRVADGKSTKIQNLGKSPEYRGGAAFHTLSASLLERMADMMNDQGIKAGKLIFVYGTLMTERSNHANYLAESTFVGAGTLHGYALYDLGFYPGIKPMMNEIVKGELFLVNSSTLKQLDSLEGEGHLYDRVTVEVRGSAVDSWLAQTYVYRGDVLPGRKIKKENQPWRKGSVKTAGVEPSGVKTAGVELAQCRPAAAVNTNPTTAMNTIHQEEFVWYACYGSNLSQTRFMEYISDCTDKTAPRESRPYQLPHRLYFGNKSKKWSFKSVAFLDPKIDQAETTLGRIYRVTVEQYLQVKKNEGAKYIYELCLGELEGMPIYTFTSPVVFPTGSPSDAYLNVIRTGLQEIWPELGTAEHERYLQTHLCRDEDSSFPQTDREGDSSFPKKDSEGDSSFHQMDKDDEPYMARIGILRSIRSSPQAFAFADIRKTVGSAEHFLFDALQSLLEEGLIKTHTKYRFGMFNPKTRYFTEPDRKADVELVLSGR